MKMFLTATLIFAILITFTISASATPPPPTIYIRGDEKLAEMRRMVTANEEEFIDYLYRTDYFWNGLRNREDIIQFLKFIDSLPIPYIEGTRFSQILYVVGNDDTYITFRTEIDEIYSFRYNYFVENLDVNREPLFKHYINQDEYANVYSASPNSHGNEVNERGAIFYIMEIDGMLVRTGYNRGDNEHITTFNPEEKYKDMIVTSFAESPWVIKYSTSDALAVLRAVAGLTALSDAESARLGISGEATTADAVRILRSVAGF